MKKLKLNREIVKILSDIQLGHVIGGAPNTNLTCQPGCQSIYCQTNNISCPVNCPLTNP